MRPSFEAEQAERDASLLWAVSGVREEIMAHVTKRGAPGDLMDRRHTPGPPAAKAGSV